MTHLPAITRQKRPPQITVKVKAAIKTMIEDGTYFADAAPLVGMSAAALRKALERPHVLSYMRQQRAAFRQSLCLRNDFVLAEVRDQTENKLAQVQATRALERLAEEDNARPVNQRAPGVVIQIIAAPRPAEGDELRGGQVIDLNPLERDGGRI